MSPTEHLAAQPLIATVPSRACAVCAGQAWHETGQAQDYEYATCSNVWTYRACGYCGHVQMDPLPAPETLRVIYPETYYSYRMEKSIHPIARWAKHRLDRAKFTWITRGMHRGVSSYLDVGCGDGRYLQLMIGQGADPARTCGVELDVAAVNSARAKGLNVIQSRIEEARELQPGTYDLITMFHVVEHVERPDEVIDRLRILLRPGGVLAIETPNFACVDARLTGKRYWGGYHTPRHWHVFTSASLQQLLRTRGFQIQRMRYQTGHAFLLWTLHHWLKYGKNRDTLGEWCHPLRNLPLLALATSVDMLRILFGRPTSAVLVVASRI